MQLSTWSTYGKSSPVCKTMACRYTPPSANLDSMLTSTIFTPWTTRCRSSGISLPTTQRKLRKFLGLVNFYHRFLPSCAQILHPVHDLLKTAPKGNNPFTWTNGSLTAFQDCKEALASASLLVHPQLDALTCILTDASDTAVGAILQ